MTDKTILSRRQIVTGLGAGAGGLLLSASGWFPTDRAAEFACGMEHTGEFPSVQMWPHRHGTDAMFAAALRVGPGAD